MDIVVHASIFIAATAVVWFSAGVLISSVDRIAKRFHKSDFTIAFFVLGFVTSIGEMSVAVNSGIEGVPQVSVGNLVGASFVILFLIIPILAVVGNGLTMRNTLSKRNLACALAFVLLPPVFAIDGNITRQEGLFTLVAYATLLYLIRGGNASPKEVREVGDKFLERKKTAWDATKIVVCALLIFFSGHFLVEETVFFADLLSLPASLAGLVLLSFGTNIPEIAIAIRAVLKKRMDIAFGDYVGSVAANTAIFGVLVVSVGSFQIESSQFAIASALMLLGSILFYIFAGSKQRISRNEGLLLSLVFGVFVVLQALNLVRFLGD